MKTYNIKGNYEYANKTTYGVYDYKILEDKQLSFEEKAVLIFLTTNGTEEDIYFDTINSLVEDFDLLNISDFYRILDDLIKKDYLIIDDKPRRNIKVKALEQKYLYIEELN